jgi:exosortase K
MNILSGIIRKAAATARQHLLRLIPFSVFLLLLFALKPEDGDAHLFLLQPLVVVVGLITGTSWESLPEASFASPDLPVIIDSTCAGRGTLLVLLGLTIVFARIGRPPVGLKILRMALQTFVCYGMAIVISALRVSLAILSGSAKQALGLSFAYAHELEGMLITLVCVSAYFFFIVRRDLWKRLH